jgi:hypothetical protein
MGMDDVNEKYWVCCGSTDPLHKDHRSKRCISMHMGRTYEHHYGTKKDHNEHLSKLFKKETNEDNT